MYYNKNSKSLSTDGDTVAGAKSAGAKGGGSAVGWRRGAELAGAKAL